MRNVKPIIFIHPGHKTEHHFEDDRGEITHTTVIPTGEKVVSYLSPLRAQVMREALLSNGYVRKPTGKFPNK